MRVAAHPVVDAGVDVVFNLARLSDSELAALFTASGSNGSFRACWRLGEWMRYVATKERDRRLLSSNPSRLGINLKSWDILELIDAAGAVIDMATAGCTPMIGTLLRAVGGVLLAEIRRRRVEAATVRARHWQ
jgi:hypothetical protein